MLIRQNNWPHRNMGLSHFNGFTQQLKIGELINARYDKTEHPSFEKKTYFFCPILKNTLK